MNAKIGIYSRFWAAKWPADKTVDHTHKQMDKSDKAAEGEKTLTIVTWGITYSKNNIL